jgi:hypothetical protein
VQNGVAMINFWGYIHKCAVSVLSRGEFWTLKIKQYGTCDVGDSDTFDGLIKFKGPFFIMTGQKFVNFKDQKVQLIFVADQGRIYTNFFNILDFKVCLWEVLLNAINFGWFCCFGRFIFFDFVNVENDAVCFTSCLIWLLSYFFCCWRDGLLFGLGLGILLC